MTETVNGTGLIRGNALKIYRSLNRVMDSIDQIVDTVNRGTPSDEGTGEIIGEVATSGSDRIEEILTTLRQIVMAVGSMDRR